MNLAIPLITSALGAGASIFGANKAAQTQLKGVSKAQATTLAMFGIGQKNLKPFLRTGKLSSQQLRHMMKQPFFNQPIEQQHPELLQPIKMDQASLEQTPGYQFIKNQGLKSLQNSYAARGLGSSGAAMKGAANFVTGLADNTYRTQFEMENINRSNIFDRALRSRQDIFGRLYDTSALGASAAGTSANIASNTGANLASLDVGGANAAAGATMSGAKSLTGLFSDLGAYGYLSPYMSKLYGRGGVGTVSGDGSNALAGG